MNKVKLTVDETPHVSNNTKLVNEAEKKKKIDFLISLFEPTK